MASSKEQRYKLLQGDGNANSQESLHTSGTAHKEFDPSLGKGRFSLQIFSILSAVANVLLAALLIFFGHQLYGKSCKPQSLYLDVSPYAGLARQPSYNFPYSTGYGLDEVANHSLLDDMWEAIDINPGVVAISLDWARENNLAETQPFPWDTSKGIYAINGFHTIHCLKNIHRAIYDAHHGRPLSRGVEHIMHCLDHMRKDAMCNADDFLLPTPPRRYGNPGPRGQTRICKNWDALVSWANDRDACYSHITDDEIGFAAEHSEIERYMNCKPNSPYAQKVQDYAASKGEERSFSG